MVSVLLTARLHRVLLFAIPLGLVIPQPSLRAQVDTASRAVPDLLGEAPSGAPTRISIPIGERALVGFTDRSSRAALGDWLRQLGPQLDSAAARRIVVVGLSGFIAPLFRSSIRSSFVRPGSTEYLLDWGGDVVAAATRKQRLPCVLIVGPDARVRAEACGAADSARVSALSRALRLRSPGSSSARPSSELR